MLLDAFLGVADAGEVGDGGALAVLLDLVQHFQVLAHVGAAGAIGAGDIIRIQGVQLLQHAACTAELLHAYVSLGGKHFEGKRGSLFKNVSYAHDNLSSIRKNRI